jgi:hypothetical protein
MIMRKGITSFFSRNPLPEFPFTEFQQIAFACSVRCGFSVAGLSERGATPNFHSASLERRDEKLLMLGHSNYRIIAFAEPREEYSCELIFRDAIDLAECVVEMYPEFTIASTTDLSLEIQESDLRMLDRAEVEQVKYWKPRTIGELAFNWWD